MGVVIRQGAKSSVVSYFSIILGFVNTIIIYPLTLEIEQLGEIQFVLQSAILILPFLLFGFSSVSSKFFSKYNGSNKEVSGFLTFLYIPPILTGFSLIVLYYLFHESIFDFFNTDKEVSKEALNAIPLIAIFMSFSSISSSFSANLKRIAIPNFLNNLIKIILPILCLGYYFKLFDFSIIYLVLVLFYLILIVIFFLYIKSISKISLNTKFTRSLNKPRLLGMLKFASFGVLASIGSQVATRIDSVMVTTLKSTYDNGIYSVAMFISNTVMVPLTLVAAIATPLIASHWQSKNMDELNIIYRKSSINLFVLGLGVFLVIWAAIDPLFAMMPRGSEFKAGKMVILILGVAKLLDMASGLNSQILSMSPKYVVFFYFVLGLSFLNVFLNIKLIPLFGINGAAISTLISLSAFNLLKYFYVKYKYNLDPITLDLFKVGVLGVMIFIMLEYSPKFGSELMNLFIPPALTLGLYVFAILKMNVSEDVNLIFNNILKKVYSLFGR
ncbi:MAG: hypothetical protein COA58_11740 [Bacteroidetes bacterium]|nr:MAG: hypothetical protein COA58_11740 [Bacteroidota bacterium]